jgi:hypothetical protein
MIQPQELRIGNYVKHNNEWSYRDDNTDAFQWNENDWYALGEGTLFLENVEPIPLTEKWLLDFGFTKSIAEYRLKISNDTYTAIVIDNRFDSMINNDGQWCFFDANIKYVHQLQNLYFALTNKELKLINDQEA